MNVRELIQALLAFDGDLEVYGTSDHGQTPEKISSPSEIWTEKDSYSIWDGEYISDDDEAEECGYTVKAVLL